MYQVDKIKKPEVGAKYEELFDWHGRLTMEHLELKSKERDLINRERNLSQKKEIHEKYSNEESARLRAKDLELKKREEEIEGKFLGSRTAELTRREQDFSEYRHQWEQEAAQNKTILASKTAEMEDYTRRYEQQNSILGFAGWAAIPIVIFLGWLVLNMAKHRLESGRSVVWRMAESIVSWGFCIVAGLIIGFLLSRGILSTAIVAAIAFALVVIGVGIRRMIPFDPEGDKLPEDRRLIRRGKQLLTPKEYAEQRTEEYLEEASGSANAQAAEIIAAGRVEASAIVKEASDKAAAIQSDAIADAQERIREAESSIGELRQRVERGEREKYVQLRHEAKKRVEAFDANLGSLKAMLTEALPIDQQDEMNLFLDRATGDMERKLAKLRSMPGVDEQMVVQMKREMMRKFRLRMGSVMGLNNGHNSDQSGLVEKD